jgi:hypothetical protein
LDDGILNLKEKKSVGFKMFGNRALTRMYEYKIDLKEEKAKTNYIMKNFGIYTLWLILLVALNRK